MCTYQRWLMSRDNVCMFTVLHSFLTVLLGWTYNMAFAHIDRYIWTSQKAFLGVKQRYIALQPSSDTDRPEPFGFRVLSYNQHRQVLAWDVPQI